MTQHVTPPLHNHADTNSGYSVFLTATAVVISFNVTGLGVDDDAARDATLAAQAANRLLEALTRAALTAFCSGLDTISMPLVPFMSAYVARLRALTKRGQALPAGAQMHIQVRQQQ